MNRFLLLAAATLTLASNGLTFAQTVTTIANFRGPDGAQPLANLVQALDGNLYGTTSQGGTANLGTIFRLAPSGALTTIYSFAGSIDGSNPSGGLLQSTDGFLYGTAAGGPTNTGSIYKIALNGAFTTLHHFSGPDGAGPRAALVQATDGNFYGVTAGGGAMNYGTVFRMTPAGAITTLHSFIGTDGFDPQGGLTQASDGNFYGTTLYYLGANPFDGFGSVFRITPGGTFSTVKELDGVLDGKNPKSTLVQATDGYLYGTTSSGGVPPGIYGTLFRFSTDGTFQNLYEFTRVPEAGWNPYAGLIQATDGNFYGTTGSGGPTNEGVIYRYAVTGISELYGFSSVGDGGYSPNGSFFQSTNGDLYGTTTFGGRVNLGTVYRLSLGLSPFVSALPAYGRPGSKLYILGQRLSTASSVTINGVPASFQVLSPALILATVPQGAQTGQIQVVTAYETLPGRANFRVLGAN